jgi:hypothetical protein
MLAWFLSGTARNMADGCHDAARSRERSLSIDPSYLQIHFYCMVWPLRKEVSIATNPKDQLADKRDRLIYPFDAQKAPVPPTGAPCGRDESMFEEYHCNKCNDSFLAKRRLPIFCPYCKNVVTEQKAPEMPNAPTPAKKRSSQGVPKPPRQSKPVSSR